MLALDTRSMFFFFFVARATQLSFRNLDGPEKGLFLRLVPKFLSLLLCLFGQKNGLDVGENATLGDGDSREQLVQLLVVADGQLEMSRDYPSFLVVPCGIACQLQDFSGQVLEHCGQVHGCSGSDTLGIIAFSQESVNSSDGELKTSTTGSGLALSLHFSTFAAT